MDKPSLIRNVWWPLLVLLTACAAPGSNQTPAMSDADVMVQAHQAEVDGKRLFDFVSQKDDSKLPEIAIALKAVTDYCPGDTYMSVEIDNARPGQDFIYLIASTDNSDDLVWGRHYRVTLDKKTSTVVSVAPSSHSCLAISLNPKNIPPGATLVSPAITHLLSPAPSEFHVFLSLTEPKPLTVMTSYGVWTVEKGKISLLEQNIPK